MSVKYDCLYVRSAEKLLCRGSLLKCRTLFKTCVWFDQTIVRIVAEKWKEIRYDKWLFCFVLCIFMWLDRTLFVEMGN